MSRAAIRSDALFRPAPEPGWLERTARGGVLRLLERLHDGRLTVLDGAARHTFGSDASGPEPLHAVIDVRHPRFWLDVATGGAMGAAESWIRGDWDTDDLTAALRVFARHGDLLAGLEAGPARLRAPLLRTLHALRRNTREGSRRNIAAHYDLGNDFFAAFLDPTMMYSSAIWPHAHATLEDASRHKLDRVGEALGLSRDTEVVEIGSGWGGFAVHAATRWGCRVTTTTISREQWGEAVERVRRAGVEDRVTVLLEDYRELPARLGRRFDRLVSIEMIEAVGHEFLPRYFSTVASLLHPEGRALVQAITLREQDHAAYLRSVDFIRRYIFPGGCLPTVASMVNAATAHTDLRVDGLDDFSLDYARTLQEWRERFRASRERMLAAGRDEAFQRTWLWYFAYCEAGFLERRTGLVHLHLARPRAGIGDSRRARAAAPPLEVRS